MLTQHLKVAVTAGHIDIIDQYAYVDAAVCSRQDGIRQVATAGIVMHNVILNIQRFFSDSCQCEPCYKGISVVAQQIKAGLIVFFIQ